MCICLASEEESEPAQVSEVLCDCPVTGEAILGQKEAAGPQFYETWGVGNGVDLFALCFPHAAVQQPGVAKPHIALSHRGTFPMVPLFFFPATVSFITSKVWN